MSTDTPNPLLGPPLALCLNIYMTARLCIVILVLILLKILDCESGARTVMAYHEGHMQCDRLKAFYSNICRLNLR